MKKVYLFLFFLLPTANCLLPTVFSQSPQGINYQAVARDAAGNPLVNTAVAIKFSIYNSIPLDTVWIETHSKTTNQFGLFTAIVGQGTKIGGSSAAFSNINWGSGTFSLRVFVNGNDMGATQFMSVPYSLYSANGTPGPTGPTGLTGSTGNTGPSGANGTNGTTGATGAAGTNGTNGATGPTGAAGSNGTNGATGPTGAAGSNGTNGATGPTGAAGSNGTNGATGPTGAAGSNGTNGATGPTGAAGSNGTNGATGPTGAAGTNGTNGATGATGAAGINGATGTTGLTGPTGNTGGIGATGPTGNTGATGGVGPIGATGITGPSGTPGASGVTGPTGFLSNGTAAGNTPYWNGASWVINSSNIFNNGGNIGVGTTGPTGRLHVLGVDNSSTAFAFGAAGASGIGGLNVRNDGNVGIGTTTPTYPLHVTSPSAANIFAANIENTNANGWGFSVRTTNTDNTKFTLATYNNTRAQYDFVVTNAGNVGIGITVPEALLHINKTDVATIYPLQLGNTNQPTREWMFDVDGTANMYIKNEGAGTPFTSMFFDNTGKVGIGTSTPLSKLNIAGTTQFDAALIVQLFSVDANPPNIKMTKSRNATIGLNTIVNINDVTGQIGGWGADGASATSYWPTGLIEFEVDGTPGINDMPGRITFNTTPDGSQIATERMRITSTGNVGIGTTTPSAKLHTVLSTTASVNAIQIDYTNTASGAGNRGGLFITHSANHPAGGIASHGIFINSTNAGLGNIIGLGAYISGNTGEKRGLDISASGSGTNVGMLVDASGGTTNTAGYFNASGGATNYAIIVPSAGGNVGIGTNAPTQLLTVFNGTTTGTYTTTGWLHSSDSRLKTNIKPIESPLEKIMKLQGVSYNWKQTPSTDNQIGFIAQDVEKVFPEVIVKDKDGNYSMALQNLTAPIVEAIKEQQEMIDDLKSTVKDLQSAMQNCCTSNHSNQNSNNNSGSELNATTIHELELENSAVLFQNTPNPYSEGTSIKYFVPDNSQAQIIFYDDFGNKIKEFTVLEKGMGQLNLTTANLANGMYSYSLVVNGKIVDTKKMVKTK